MGPGLGMTEWAVLTEKQCGETLGTLRVHNQADTRASEVMLLEMLFFISAMHLVDHEVTRRL